MVDTARQLFNRHQSNHSLGRAYKQVECTLGRKKKGKKEGKKDELSELYELEKPPSCPLRRALSLFRDVKVLSSTK